MGGYFWGRNDMKTYEATYFKITYRRNFGQGINALLDIQYQNRKPMDNVVESLNGKTFSPNFPTTLMSSNLVPHKSLVLNFNITWRPFSKYLELPERLINLGSKYPTLNVNVSSGLKSIFESDVDFLKWRVTASQNLNLKLYGKLDAKFIVGGFSNTNKLYTPDYQHYLGNEIVVNTNYMNGFQLLPYYTFSNTSSLYTESHFEYHLNGFISNKIPIFKKLNWFFVVGLNTLNVNGKPNYFETFASVEKIFRLFRVDFVNGYLQKKVNLPITKMGLIIYQFTSQYRDYINQRHTKEGWLTGDVMPIEDQIEFVNNEITKWESHGVKVVTLSWYEEFPKHPLYQKYFKDRHVDIM